MRSCEAAEPPEGDVAYSDSSVQTLPLSLEQEWFYLTRLAEPGRRLSLTRSYDIRGPFDAGRFLAALRDVAMRHDGLRVRLAFRSGLPCLRVRPPGEDLPIICQAVAASRKQFEAYASGLANLDRSERWNPVRDPLYRLRLLRRTDSEYIFIATFDHLAYDERSVAIFERDLWLAYRGPAAGAGDPTGEALTLGELLLRERAAYEHRADTVGRHYWDGRYARVAPVWQPTIAASGGGTGPGPRGAAHYLPEQSTVAALRQACRASSSSPFEVCVAIFARLAFSLTRQDRLAVYVTLDGREAAYADVVGMLASVRPLIVDRADMRSPEFVGRVRRELFGALAHRHCRGADELQAVARQQARWQLELERSLAVSYMKIDDRQLSRASQALPGQRSAPAAGTIADSPAAGPPPSGDRVAMTRASYGALPRGRAASALGLFVFDSGSAMRVELLYSTSTLDGPMAEKLLSRFDAELRNFADGRAGSDDTPPPAGPEGEAELSPLRDLDGAVSLHADLALVRRALQSHQAVATARAEVVRHPDGGDEVAAVIMASSHVEDENLREICRTWPEATPYLVPPGRFTITEAAGAGRAGQS